MKKLIIAAAIGLTLAASMHVSANTGIEAGIGTKESYIDAQVLPKTSIGYSRLDLHLFWICPLSDGTFYPD